MKSRKLGSVKAAGLTKPKALGDVPASTSLPPLVEGELRGFLRVTVSRLRWSVARPPPVTRVRLRWWGESSDGTLFIPRRDDASPSHRSVKTTARFPVRCGTKQLTSYLADMGSLVLEVLSKHDCLPVAHARVPDISRLSQSQPITGFYALVSPSSKKLGQLEVSLHLEPVAGACRKRGSGADVSSDVPHVATLDKAPPPATDKSYVSSGGNTFRGKDGPQTHRDETVENFKLQANGHKEDGRPRNDILSVILERGSKLRDAMLVSALKSDVDAAPVLKDLQLPLQRDNARAPSMPSQAVLEKIPHAQADDEVGDRRLGSSSDVDLRAVDLLLGRSKTPPPWQGEGSFPDTLSIHSSASGDSELGDPQYDHSLLENLFYKTPMSDSRADEAAADGQRQTESPSATDTDKQLRPSASTTGDDVAAELQGASTLSQERLTFLSFMRLVKVTVCSVSVPACCASPPTEKPPSKSPSLLRRKKCTYFVEYSFPKTSSSGRHGRSVVPGVEVTRAASSNVTEGVVSFNQLSVFPVRFSKTTVEVWWSTELLFRIYVRKKDQKKAVVMGEASHPLRCLLQSQRLSQSLALPVRTVDGAVRQLCLLKVLLELSTGNSDSEMCEKREDSSTRSTQSPPRESSQRLEFCSEEPAARPSEDSAPNVPPVRRSAVTLPPARCADEAPEVLLHTLLMVPDGKNFTGGPAQAVNVYLNCKMFWCDEVARSVVSWGRANPSFNFVQVTPVALTAHLLERMRNNVMVIEVWQKTGGSGHEGLLGLVKLPLHQFYMSFRDPKIAQLLLQAQYPVLGVDCYMPVVDVFSGGCRGSLRVTLAMGLCEQVLALQRARDEEGETPGRPPLGPLRLLEHQPAGLPAKAAGYFRAGDSSAASLAARAPAMTEHVFTIRVEKVTGLTPLQSTVWGEADCYVQYAFPCQEGAHADAATLHEYNTDLRPFRTATTLCVPDPVLGHTETHALLAPEGVPVQKLLLSSLSSQGLSGGGGVHFEVWCRYYYPNVREQLVAKGILPLSKLCAMVTMQGQHPAEARMFSIPLLPTADDLAAHQPLPSGLLDVRVRYNYRPARADAPAAAARGAASCPVTLVLQVHRACGLQAAARAVAQHDERYDYFASVGVNSYVSVRLSFLPDDEPTCTRVAARTFCPEFEHLAEVGCHALVRKSGGETCSLAEQLAEAWAVFAVWNKDSRRGATCRPPDVMLGTVKIQLVDLLRKTTGISGWFGISAARESPQSQHASVGGLEISIGFAHHSERERLIRVARDLGWDPTRAQVDCDELGAWELSARKLSLTLSVPRAWLPLRCLLLPGHDSLQRSTYCYLRYKFYEDEAFCSHMKHPCAGEATEGDRATVTFQGSRTLQLMSSQPLLWYLREERLEVQVWVAFQKDKGQRPRDTDRLLGSAFVDLSSLAKAHGHKLTLSGVYPLFRRSAADLQGAALRVHISLTADGHLPTAEDPPADSDSQEETLVEEPAVPLSPPPPTVPPTVPPPTAPPPPLPPQPTQSQTAQDDASSRAAQVMSDDLSFPVTLAVHGAKNLSLNGESGEGTLRCYVSYVVADSAEPVSTAVAAQSDRPVWDHQHDCRLSKQLLLDPQQSLVFKVWHKGGAEAERAIGFASVDLTPLLCGLRSLCGWYNVTDFGGHCRGQLKVSVQPLEWVQDLRGQRKAGAAADAEPSSGLAPRSYRTSATYSSFPSHISRYPEQHISSPKRVDAVFPQSSAPSDSERHHEHMQNVRLHHRSLQEQAGLHWGSGDELTPSSSLLFSTIRKIMSEQDNIQRYFSSKIAPPAFLTASEPDERESEEGAAPHFLVTSPHNGQSQEAICSILHSRSAKEKHADASSSPHAASSRQPSFPTSQPEEKESEEAESTDGDGECRSRCSSEEEEEDYEEVVVEPRHLNELPISTQKSALQNSVPSHPDQSRTKSGGGQEAVAHDRPPDSMDESSEDASISPSEDDAVGAGGSARPKQVSLPNFFLPSQQLEASLREVRLAPSFSNSSGDTERVPTPPQIPRRGPRHCPDMSPTSRKRQTERFARICAARLDDDDD
ncbi:C2 domain-containing protein 3 isoform X2 [Syngnathus scovelli]|uniref:C2 domain-containing protein 3 isoform X2 n=1 Tax=Syngnathus scovelli TaxID=161590 RepID=UPI00210FC286|nr:C2 domain-containing protein 3 isoform X2 [Syngnathus scovelli]